MSYAEIVLRICKMQIELRQYEEYLRSLSCAELILHLDKSMKNYTSGKKPCLIGQDPTSKLWLAWNEDARLLTRASTVGFLLGTLRALDYEPVSPNSRCAATIRDKMRSDRGFRI